MKRCYVIGNAQSRPAALGQTSKPRRNEDDEEKNRFNLFLSTSQRFFVVWTNLFRSNLAGPVVFARFNLGMLNLDAFSDLSHQFVNDASGGVGNGYARCGHPRRRVFRRVVQQAADNRRDVTRSVEQYAGVVSGDK